jgi:hypothetical protein
MQPAIPSKLSHNVSGEWEEFSPPPIFECSARGSNAERVAFGVPGGDVEVIRSLVRCVTAPFDLLYVLHTPRGEGLAGRYQSPPLSLQSVLTFLTKYADFLRADARYDLWVHSSASEATIVFDRHNRGFAYGPIACFVEALTALGFTPGSLPAIPAHAHHYRAEFDAEAANVLAEYSWRRTELRPEDAQ